MVVVGEYQIIIKFIFFPIITDAYDNITLLLAEIYSWEKRISKLGHEGKSRAFFIGPTPIIL